MPPPGWTHSTPATVPLTLPKRTRVTKQTAESGKLDTVFAAVEQWAEAQGLAIVDAPRETYWPDFGAAAPADQVLDVCFPVE